MGMSYRRYLSGERIYGCSKCKTHLATIHTMMSRVIETLIMMFLIVADHPSNRRSTDSMVERTSLMVCKSCSTLRPASSITHFNSCSVNVIEGEPDDRPMTTGNHTVRDIYCCKCGTTLGWKYVNTLISLPPIF